MAQTQKSERENKKKKGAIHFIVWILTAIQLILAAVLFVKLSVMRILPVKYMVAYAVFFIVLNALTLVALKKKPIAVFMGLLSLVISAGLVYGMTAVFKLDATLNKVSSDKRLEIVQMAVLVLEDDSAHYFADIAGYEVGYIDGDEAANELMTQVDEAVSAPVSYSSYANVIFLVNALLDGSEEAVVLNNAYIDIISELEDYTGFSEQVRVLDIIEVETYVDVEEPTTEETTEEEPFKLSSDEDTFILYISGIDVWGGVNVQSRSDVNILAVVNTRTGHIQLINTPRDYYVTLPNSGSSKDKLTHAGLYGVDTSMGALENLYGIEIDYFVRMNFSGFESIIDTLGGIDVYSEYDFTVEPIKHYTEGYNHLTGLEALAFARERHAFAAGDNQRGKNQMAVIQAMVQKLASKEFLYHYDEILDDLEDCFQTDMPADFIYSLVRYQLSNETEWKIDTFSVTGYDSYAVTYSVPGVEAYVMLPNEDDIAEAAGLIEETLAEK